MNKKSEYEFAVDGYKPLKNGKVKRFDSAKPPNYGNTGIFVETVYRPFDRKKLQQPHSCAYRKRHMGSLCRKNHEKHA